MNLPIQCSLKEILRLRHKVFAPRDRSPKQFSTTRPLDDSLDTVFVSETTDEFGAIKYSQTRRGAVADLLWLTMTYDQTSWGHNPGGDPRSIDDLLEIVQAQHNVTKTSLGLLTSSLDEFKYYKHAVTKLPFPKITIILHPGLQDSTQTHVSGKQRHDDRIQQGRRAELAKLRNYLMLKSLREETHIIWLDADVFYLDDGIVSRMLKHVRARPGVGILTARCAKGLKYDYDLNAWRGTRRGPRGWDLDQAEIDAGEEGLQGQYQVLELLDDTKDDDLVPLDTVGATLLYMRASLVWRGLTFPHQYIVGTRWGKDGWDGIESEGLCYRARGLKGGKCMLLGDPWHVEHTVD